MVTLDAVLEDLRGKTVFFEPAGGNHGDALIEMGSRKVLKERGILLTGDARQADAVVVNGSGGLGVELWNEGLTGLRNLAQAFREQPFIVLPSSFYFEADHLAACFVSRTAPAWLFARDRRSLERLGSQTYPSDVQIGVADDMAFALRDSPFLAGLKQKSAARHILLVERFDREATTAPPQPIDVPSPLRRYTPRSIKFLLKKMVHQRRVASSTFTPTTLDRLYAQAPEYVGLPLMNQDISSTVGFTFEQFLDAIAAAAVVITTRLHVGILAALLNKPTYLIASHSGYRKLESVYEYSMADMPHVHLW